MKYRIITHAGCTDGFCSAFIFKRYFSKLLDLELNEPKMQEIEVIGLQPYALQTGEFAFQEKDIVLDLPKPDTDIFFWCDHHLTSKPSSKLPKNHYWHLAPSCTGLLLEVAKEKGLQLSKELQDFKKAIDTIDDAQYTKEDILACYYPQKDYQNLTSLQKLTILGAMFHTKDFHLNEEVFRTLLSQPLLATPISEGDYWQLNPLMFHKARLAAYKEWREHIDTFIYYDKNSRCVVQDNRKVLRQYGNADRFYSFIKFPQAAYSLSIRPQDDQICRVGIGSNIFHKERCKVNIGKLCRELGKKFGEGAGGGHFAVGGTTIFIDNCDRAVEFILERLSNPKS